MIKTVNVDVIFSEKRKWWDKKLSTTQAFRSATFHGWGWAWKGNTRMTRDRRVKPSGCGKKAFQKKKWLTHVALDENQNMSIDFVAWNELVTLTRSLLVKQWN